MVKIYEIVDYDSDEEKYNAEEKYSDEEEYLDEEEYSDEESEPEVNTTERNPFAAQMPKEKENTKQEFSKQTYWINPLIGPESFFGSLLSELVQLSPISQKKLAGIILSIGLATASATGDWLIRDTSSAERMRQSLSYLNTAAVSYITRPLSVSNKRDKPIAQLNTSCLPNQNDIPLKTQEVVMNFLQDEAAVNKFLLGVQSIAANSYLDTSSIEIGVGVFGGASVQPNKPTVLAFEGRPRSISGSSEGSLEGSMVGEASERSYGSVSAVPSNDFVNRMPVGVGNERFTLTPALMIGVYLKLALFRK